jgi:hut operon positive regulator
MASIGNTISLGRAAVFLVMFSGDEEEALMKRGQECGYKMCKGKVGSMDSAKIFSAIETAARREGLIDKRYREEHALYHSVLEAYSGMCRGQDGLGSILRSAGLLFSIVRGYKVLGGEEDGEWIAVALYGNMGAPIRGFEHEVLGLGMNPI